MKSILAVAFMVALVAAEVPSNSYLPPPPNRRYPQSSLPSVIAARTLDHGAGQHHDGDHGVGAGTVNGFVRNGAQHHANPAHTPEARSRFIDDQGYGQNAAGYARNAVEDINGGPASYDFGYSVIDQGTDFGHHEARLASSAHGEYHVVLPDGRRQTVSYEADERGYKPQISYEDSEDVARSGYGANANFRGNGYHGNGQDGGHSANIRGNGYNSNGQDGGQANSRSNGYN